MAIWQALPLLAICEALTLSTSPTTTLGTDRFLHWRKNSGQSGKNKKILWELFWQPCLVLIDPETLDTLSPRLYAAGLAEALKAGLLADSELVRIFEEEDCKEYIEQIIYRSLIVKKNIVGNGMNEKLATVPL